MCFHLNHVVSIDSVGDRLEKNRALLRAGKPASRPVASVAPRRLLLRPGPHHQCILEGRPSRFLEGNICSTLDPGRHGEGRQWTVGGLVRGSLGMCVFTHVFMETQPWQSWSLAPEPLRDEGGVSELFWDFHNQNKQQLLYSFLSGAHRALPPQGWVQRCPPMCLVGATFLRSFDTLSEFHPQIHFLRPCSPLIDLPA